MSARRCRSAVGLRRRQPEGVFRKLGGGDGRPTGARKGRGVVEGSGDPGVRPLRRERKVATACNRIVENRRNESVRAPPLVGGHALVDDRRKKRVRESNRPVRAFDDMHRECGREYVRRDAQANEEARRTDGPPQKRARARGESPAEVHRDVRPPDRPAFLECGVAASVQRLRSGPGRARGRRRDCRPTPHARARASAARASGRAVPAVALVLRRD